MNCFKGNNMLDFNKDMQSFVEKVIPKDASETQIKEMRKAFISGAKITAYRALNDEDFIDYIEEIDDMFNLVCLEKE